MSRQHGFQQLAGFYNPVHVATSRATLSTSYIVVHAGRKLFAQAGLNTTRVFALYLLELVTCATTAHLRSLGPCIRVRLSILVSPSLPIPLPARSDFQTMGSFDKDAVGADAA